MNQVIEADYLIVGAGAVGMAFADVLLSETDKNMVIVDQHHKPGGHWNDAYPFVSLHQPSAFYGVSSKELSKGRIDQTGSNQGLGELAAGSEVSAYFDEVMRHQFLPSGRVQYFPMCEYQGDRKFRSKLTDEEFEVVVGERVVDATFLKTTVPKTHTPNFTIAEGVPFVPLNDLPEIAEKPAGFVVIGGGKTGIDACLWLLENGVDPSEIQWVMPRDAWLTDRRTTQPASEFFEDTIGGLANQMEAIAQASSIENLFDRLEDKGILVRIDKKIRPTMFHGATVSQLELAELRRIKQVIRMGRITQLEQDEIVFEHGRLPTSPRHLHVDCSASAVGNLEPGPVFSGEVITPQTVRSYQPVFSAAFIAHIEATYENEADKKRLCGVVPLPNHDTDWIRGTAASMMNQYLWSQEEGLREWLLENRLDGMSRLMQSASKDNPVHQEILGRLRENVKPAMAKLQGFLMEIAKLDSERTSPSDRS